MTALSAKELIQTLIDKKQSMAVWEFSDCPLEDKYEYGHGGDEDFVVVYENDVICRGYSVVKALTVCDHIDRTFHIDGREFTISITSHA